MVMIVDKLIKHTHFKLMYQIHEIGHPNSENGLAPLIIQVVIYRTTTCIQFTDAINSSVLHSC